MGKIKTGTLILMATILASCYVKSTKDGFRKTHYCFDEENTGLDQKIKLNGYYELTHEFTGKRFFKVKGEPKLQSEVLKRKSTIKFAFYPIGISMIGLSVWNPVGGTPSRYIQYNDTIKILHTSSPNSQTHPLIYDFFRIINDSTLEYLGFSYNKELDAERMRVFKEGNADKLDDLGTYTHAHFVPYDSLPEIDNIWLKRKKWFWCDEAHYKAWKKEQKGD